MLRTPSLTTLPQELTDNVSSRLEQKDLLSLSQTCKKIRAATEENLFRSVHMVWRADGGPQNHVLESPRLDLLLRTIVEQPRFASYICEIHLQASGYRTGCDGWYQVTLPRPLEPHAALFKAALRQTGVPLTAELETAIEENNIHAVTALFLLLTPNVRSLTLGLELIRRNLFLPYILRNIVFAPPSAELSKFSSLETLNFGPDLDSHLYKATVEHLEEELDLQAYLPFFYLSGLKDVEMNLPNMPRSGPPLQPGELFTWPKSEPGHAPAIGTLLLTRTFAQPKILGKVLPCLPNLSRLEYDYALFYKETLDASALSSALDLVKNTLKHLKISFEAWEIEECPMEMSNKFGVRGYCSLKNLQVLETVDITPPVLLGWVPSKAPKICDVLPPSLTCIRLRDDCYEDERYRWMQSDLEPLLVAFMQNERWRATNPQLRRFDILHRDWEGEEELRHLCNRNALDCKIAESDWALEEAAV